MRLRTLTLVALAGTLAFAPQASAFGGGGGGRGVHTGTHSDGALSGFFANDDRDLGTYSGTFGAGEFSGTFAPTEGSVGVTVNPGDGVHVGTHHADGTLSGSFVGSHGTFQGTHGEGNFSGTYSVSEPFTLLAVGFGLLGAARLARRRF
jgi:hypothetical protein